MEPALRSSPAPAQSQVSQSSGSSKSHDGFVSVNSASRLSGSQHGLNSGQAASEPSGPGQVPNSPVSAKDRATSDLAQDTPVSQSSDLDPLDESSSSQPDATDPFKKSLHALHAEQQASTPQQPADHQASPDSKQGSQQADEHSVAAEKPQEPAVVVQVPAQASFQKPAGNDSSSTTAASTAATHPSASTEAGSDVISASPIGSASTDAWEMVQDANNIYNWKAGSLFGRSLSSNRRQGSECSEEGESYSQCRFSLPACCVLLVLLWLLGSHGPL